MMQPNYECGHFLELEPGVELYYEDRGQGDPILFIPGITMALGVFEKQAAYFAKKYRVLAMDPRSQGRSGKTVYGNTYAQHGRDMAKLIDHLDLKNLTLVGWSSGATDVLAYIDQFGTGRLKAVVHIDMPPKALSPDPQDWVEFSMEDMNVVLTELLASSTGQRRFFADFTRQTMLAAPTDEEVETIVNMSLNTPYHIFHTLYANLVVGDWRPAAKTASEEKPFLAVIAEHWADIAVPYVNKHFPKSKTLVLGGHMMFWDRAGEFNQAIEKFIESAVR